MYIAILSKNEINCGVLYATDKSILVDKDNFFIIIPIKNPNNKSIKKALKEYKVYKKAKDNYACVLNITQEEVGISYNEQGRELGNVYTIRSKNIASTYYIGEDI